ncbi:TetR family transcriptional regulator [Streptomyces sp. AK02-01A]|uniref:TetR family transcriptional regulator n=1 Tax=Streptomyces sp. AK02-01A TaxID=3028648 RepID=UPI0029B38B37|nr:TetR family transcriptional regulator [Streptomyces sp. AK02-01A]MDX3853697.1 TetR family transcriptional regulator [Streptomyces sp. AK02-01A]
MAGNAQATRERLIKAATQEFAAHGIAGGRVERIANAARSNKAQIYHYFGSKEALFDAVFEALVVKATQEILMDPGDLPGYAGRLFDGYEELPEVSRLAAWYRLERAERHQPIQSIISSSLDKIDAIERAQKSGLVPDRFTATELLTLVLTLAATWTAQTPEYHYVAGKGSRDQRRKLVTDSVAALLAAPPGPRSSEGRGLDRPSGEAVGIGWSRPVPEGGTTVGRTASDA